MVQRRTRALAELAIDILLLPVLIRLWRFQFDHADEIDEAEPYPVSPTALSVGAVSGIAERWLYDHNVWNIRTNRWRRILFNVRWPVRNHLIRRYASEPGMFRHNYSIGTVIGTIGYRLWYGLLHPLPGEDDETSA